MATTNLAMTGVTGPATLVEKGSSTVNTMNGPKKVTTLVPFEQKSSFNGFNTTRQINVDNFRSTFFQGSNTAPFLWPLKYVLDRTETIAFCMNITIAFTNSATSCILTPTPYWFPRIDILASPDNRYLQTFMADTNMCNTVISQDTDRLKIWLRRINVDDSDGSIYGPGDALTAGTYNVWMSLPGNFFEPLDVSLAALQQQLIFQFFPSSGIVQAVDVSSAGTYAGSTAYATVTANSMTMYIGSANLDHTHQKQVQLSQIQSGEVEWAVNFLDPAFQSFIAQPLTAGTTLKLDMSGFQGACSHILWIARPTGTADPNLYFRTVDLGGDATIDLLDQGGKSILGEGAPQLLAYKRSHNIFDVRNQFLSKKKGFNVLPFGDRIVDAVRGVQHGYFPFRQEKLNLGINPKLGQPEVHTYTYGTLTSLTTGTFELTLPNGERAGEFLVGASDATIAGLICNTNIGRRSGWIPHGTTGNNVMVYNQLGAAGHVLTITIYDPEGNFLMKPIQVRCLEGKGAGAIAGTGADSSASVCAITQKGISGLYAAATIDGQAFTATNGANYDIYVYPYMYKKARYYPSAGAIKVEYMSVY